MTPEEAKQMEGTEFTYVFEDGDTIQAYVKKVDPEKFMFSCWSFGLVTDQGYKFIPSTMDEEHEGAKCVMMCKENDEERFFKVLSEIKTLKKHQIVGE
jgi:hypothetical protein